MMSMTLQSGSESQRPLNLLLATYEYPPVGGIAVQRAIKFAKYLPSYGIHPVVLTNAHGVGFAQDPTLLRRNGLEGVKTYRLGGEPLGDYTRRRNAGTLPIWERYLRAVRSLPWMDVYSEWYRTIRKDLIGLARDERIETLEDELDAANRAERKAVRERRTVSRLKREIDRLGRELDRVSDERDQLAATLERLKDLWRLDHDDFDAIAGNRELVPVKPVEKLTVDAIETAADRFGLATDDVILLRDATGAGSAAATRLANIEPRVILKHGGLSDAADEVLFDAGIPIGDADAVRIREIDDLAVANANDVSMVIDEWHERAAERRRQNRVSLVDQVISEHRAERKRADSE